MAHKTFGAPPRPAPAAVTGAPPGAGDMGGRRDDAGKPRMDLVAPSLMLAVARVAMFGAVKYAPRNWERGMPYSKPYACLLRHLLAWWSGEDRDAESGLSHLDHVAWNAHALIEYERRRAAGELPDRIDDRPHRAAEVPL